MSVQAELLCIGGEIILRENPLRVPCKDGGVQQRWFNTEKFRIGLGILAMAQGGGACADGTFTSITFGLLHPDLEAKGTFVEVSGFPSDCKDTTQPVVVGVPRSSLCVA
jgi:hypothetical protein